MYDIVFSEEVLEELAALDAPMERRKFLAAVQCLPADPSNPGVAEALDLQGRSNRIAVISGVAIVYWADHVLRKMRVLALQPVVS